ncbi:MAG: pantetheine-phosphate adenylyltransferase [Actinobacteria bacterium]|nr:pantetheine-phosphate adenylyltransferase [Actinomycetota bacterium]
MKALFAATFDPVTNGHMDVLRRALRCFDSIVVGVYDDPEDSTLFSIADRVALIRQAAQDLPHVIVLPYRGITVEFAHAQGARILIRGLRALSDFENEFALSNMNHRLDAGIDTVFFFATPDHAFVSSTLVREIGMLGRSVEQFVPANVAAAMAAKYRSRVAGRG